MLCYCFVHRHSLVGDQQGGMKYLVYMIRKTFQLQQVDIVEADNFRVKDNHIIFKRGFRTVSLFHADCVEKILKEGESEHDEDSKP